MAKRALLVVTVLLFATFVAAACGGGSDPVPPDPSVAPFVGTWDADSLTLKPVAADSPVVNILQAGSFFITVEPSGQYTASLEVLGSSDTQVGQMSVSGSTLTLTPTVPPGEPPVTGTYSFQSDDYLILDGRSDFDFNRDGMPEDADAHFELRRR